MAAATALVRLTWFPPKGIPYKGQVVKSNLLLKPLAATQPDIGTLTGY